MEFDEDKAHCSNHAYWACGCSDCDAHEAIRSDDEEDKLEKVDLLELLETQLQLLGGNDGSSSHDSDSLLCQSDAS